MSLLHPSWNKQAYSLETEDWEATLDKLSRQLCSKKELAHHTRRQEMYVRNGVTRVKLFPIWRRYRRKAERVVRIQSAFPILRRFPLCVSSFISDILE